MSRFVRASKYRHVFGQQGKKEYGFDNVKVTNSAWDTNLIAASSRYISVNWNASGGGAFAILPLPSPFEPLPFGFPTKLPDLIPLARSHSAPVLDTDWSPFNDAMVASAGDDGKVMLWKVESAAFEGWGTEHWEPQDFDPVLRIDVSPRRVGQVLFHPTANNVLASTTSEHTVKIWDLEKPEAPRALLGGHGDAIQSLAFNPSGNLLVTTCRDRKIRLFDPRVSGDAVRVAEGHGGIKGARVVWMGERDNIATTGFSKMSDRQIAIWETGGLSNIKMTTIDQTSGTLMPFWSDNNILFLAGKGDGNIRYYEYESDQLYGLAEHKSSDPQRGMCFLPRRALNVSDCEIARAYKLSGSSIEPIAFIVPRKSDSFQSDIYPPAPSSEPALTAGEFFSGKTTPPNLVSLDTGAITAGAPPSAVPVPSASVPTRTVSAPTPTSVSVPSISVETTLAPTSAAVRRPEPSPVATPVEPRTPLRSHSGDDASAVKEENARLTAELREARAQIRNLELQVESIKANARKAAALLDS
ncbi:microtubule binding protein [Rhodofomes roseus]|uniref:Coronin n=1 Tax=Rhodofomes roseus TaxID=34475 RepID=A0ABQ8K5U2_9APHY|nr:microtubule binding protein [Rhodofomes roseus]KAH9832465.1 microtubule binding protein [Rhodofomes roseus]